MSWQPDYTCVATDLLGRITSEMKALKVSNQRLTLAMVAAGHDLRQRLHLLLATVELLASTKGALRSAELNQRAKSLIIGLAGELEQLAVQAGEKGPSGARSPHCFAISDLLGELKCDWEAEAARKCLRFSIDQPDCRVYSDRQLLTVILNNLVGNAVQHTAKGCVTVSSTIEGSCAILAVSDTGPGISHEDLCRSFSLSSRSGRSKQGMGLGLSIARKSAEMLGHEFNVSTPVSGGTCIRLHIPLAVQR
jgi:hypothetical protein